MAQRIAAADAHRTVQCKEDLHAALELNQYVAPKRKMPMMTSKFMTGVIEGKYWLPKSREINKYRVCAFPPTKAKLAETLSRLLGNHPHVEEPGFDEAIRRTAVQVRKRPPNKEWLLLIIAQLDPDNFIFSKHHTREHAQPVDEEPVLVHNPDGFFDNLPIRSKAKRRGVSFLPGAARKAQKVEKLARKANRVNERLAEARAAQAEDSDSSSEDEMRDMMTALSLQQDSRRNPLSNLSQQRQAPSSGPSGPLGPGPSGLLGPGLLGPGSSGPRGQPGSRENPIFEAPLRPQNLST